MKIFGFNLFGSSADDRKLTPMQVMLKAALLPEFKRAATLGYSIKELGKALIDHTKRKGGTITAEEATAVMRDPEKLLLEYRKNNGKPNKPSAQQIGVLKATVTGSEAQAKAQEVLCANFVVDAIPPIAFKSMVQQLVACSFNPSAAQLQAWKQRA